VELDCHFPQALLSTDLDGVLKAELDEDNWTEEHILYCASVVYE